MTSTLLFNIRVYGLLINDDNHILVTDEYHFGKMITKFPGGGLHFGEGLTECLQREWMEETGQAIEVLEHFYTTDFFQASAFNPMQQVISIYYKVRALSELKQPVKDTPFDFDNLIDGAQCFRWVDRYSLHLADFTFPIEKKVAELLIK